MYWKQQSLGMREAWYLKLRELDEFTDLNGLLGPSGDGRISVGKASGFNPRRKNTKKSRMKYPHPKRKLRTVIQKQVLKAYCMYHIPQTVL